MMERTIKRTKATNPKKTNLSYKARKSSFVQSRPIISPINHIMFLQRTIGNQAVHALFRSSVIQRKLKSGQSTDIYKQEENRVADAVMSMPESQVRQQTEREEVQAQNEDYFNQNKSNGKISKTHSNLFIQRKIDWKGGKIKSRRNVAKLLVKSKGKKAQLGQTYPVVNSTKIKKMNLSQLAKVIPDPEIETKPIGNKKAECWVKNALNITGSAECDVLSKGTGSPLAWRYPIEKALLNTAFGQTHCGGTGKLKLTITGKPSTEAIAKQVTIEEGEHTTEFGKAFKTHIGAYDKAVNKYVGSKNKITGAYEGPKLDFCKMDLETRIKISKNKQVKAWIDDMQKSIKKLDTPPSHHYKSKVKATAFCGKAEGMIKHA